MILNAIKYYFSINRNEHLGFHIEFILVSTSCFPVTKESLIQIQGSLLANTKAFPL